MIEDARKIPPGSILEADLCIIGGGSAAIAVALELIKTNQQVILLPGGGRNQSPSAIDLYRGRITPTGSHEPLEENRLRMWGGTTTVWGGRCVPFDPIDFEARPWVPHSGWPIGHSDLVDHVARACELSEAGIADFDARSVLPATQAEILRGFDNDEFATWPLERWSIPTDYCRRYRDELENAPNLRILLHANAIHLQMATNGHELQSVKTACTPGKDFRIKAHRTVLACGALENARLLLASNDVLPAGIGNGNDLVGRYYQSHRFGVCGYAKLKNPTSDFMYEFEKDPEGVYCRRRFWLTPMAQERHQVTNAVGFFFRNAAGSSEHRNAMVSSVLLAKTFIGGASKGPKRLFQILKDQRKELAAHLGIVLKDAPSLFIQLSAVVYTRLIAKRRLPMVLPPRKSNCFPLFFQTEHAPDPESRVMLDPASRDDFGMPRLDAKIRFSEIDFRTVTNFIRRFQERLETTGLGSFHLNEGDRAFLANPQLQEFNSNSHNIGTTRMAKTAEGGVVDVNCKVHGVDNLYVAGSSIFPTSSHANPTLMIIALALRLADHLKTKQ